MSSAIRNFMRNTHPKKQIAHDLASIRYNTPTTKDMVVILAFFNPAKSFRIIQNLYTVKQLLEMSGIPLYIGEVAHGDAPFVLPPSPTIYQYRTSSIMFYKENIMTQVLRKVPAAYTKVLFLDADILFVDPEWYTKISESLNTYDILQPYKSVNKLNISFGIAQTDTSIVSGGGSPGYAWAFKREWLSAHPLFEYALTGGGDTIIYTSLSNYAEAHTLYKPDIPSAIEASPELPNVSFIDLEIVHLPHGSLSNRQYVSRYDRIKSIMLAHKMPSLSSAVYRTCDGIFEWRPEYREAMNAALLDYFTRRDDDGI